MNLPSYFSYSGTSPLEIRETAENLFRTNQFFCSEAVVKSLRDAFCPEIPDHVIAMASGFPVGIGSSGCTCGAVAGGVIFLGLVFGRTKPMQFVESGNCMKLARELHDKFKSENGSICCRVLTKSMEKGSAEHNAQCIRFTGDVAQAVAEIILREISK